MTTRDSRMTVGGVVLVLLLIAAAVVLYRSTGTGCTVRTVLRGQEFIRTFIKEDSADASIRWIDSSRTVAQVYRYVREEERWKYQSGFSTSSPSRWSP